MNSNYFLVYLILNRPVASGPERAYSLHETENFQKKRPNFLNEEA